MPNDIIIPTRLNELLKKDKGLSGAVDLTLSDFGIWLSDNKLVFFPEYTDHGVDHVNRVILSAGALISDESWDVLTPEDSAVLILSILLHDCAMHISDDGFLDLMSQETITTENPYIEDTKPWQLLWNEFLQEASRLDGRTLHKIFGSSEPTRRPPENPMEWTQRDRLLIGEFLRRHHPRIAQEVALSGVPSVSTNKLSLSKVPTELAELAGYIARSHGLSLRYGVDKLPREQRRKAYNTHPSFLMSILRIADYFHIESDRAPKQILQVKTLKSPLSSEEWTAHEAIKDIKSTHDDPEAIYIEAKPKTVDIFLKLRGLFDSIQSELDQSHAVLGEVYGRIEVLKTLGLNIRRIRSNFDEDKDFVSKINYIPEEITFKTAGADLLKLLIAPLYGDNPEYGIRELLQNSVDACREIEDSCDIGRLQEIEKERIQQEADVVISFDIDKTKKEENGSFTISDRGIGMTADVIQNYFLCAGASYRKSDSWKKEHTDQDGKSRVLRSGRFGIGVLAAFLIGTRIKVTTRHMTETTGLEFECGVDDESVELRKVECPIGTTIHIIVNNSDFSDYSEDWVATKWDWYCLSTPSVVRKFNGEILLPENLLPAPNSKLPYLWRRIEDDNFSDIQWSIEKGNQPAISCNGIRVMHRPRYRSHTDNLDRLNLDCRDDNFFMWCSIPIISTPDLSIFDPDGYLPLNLERTALTQNRHSFEKQLVGDICNDFLAFILVNAPSTKYTASPIYHLIKPPENAELFWFAENGLAFIEPWNISQLKPRSLTYIKSLRSLRHSKLGDFIQSKNPNLIPANIGSGTQANQQWFRSAIMRGYSFQNLSDMECIGRRVVITKKWYEELASPRVIAQHIWDSVKIDFNKNGWVVVTYGNCPESNTLLHEILDMFIPEEQYTGVAEWYLNDQPFKNFHSSAIAGKWRDIIKLPYIPYDLAERREKLKHAYEKLAPYIEAHEELAKSKKKKSDTDDGE